MITKTLKQEFTIGDILESTHRGFKEGLHYIIYFDAGSDNGFLGAMLTKLNHELNIEMIQDHFHPSDNLSQAYKVTYRNSFLVKAKLEKPYKWGPFTKVGTLTPLGVEFVKNNIANLSSESWEDYCTRTKLNFKDNGRRKG